MRTLYLSRVSWVLPIKYVQLGLSQLQVIQVELDGGKYIHSLMIFTLNDKLQHQFAFWHSLFQAKRSQCQHAHRKDNAQYSTPFPPLPIYFFALWDRLLHCSLSLQGHPELSSASWILTSRPLPGNLPCTKPHRRTSLLLMFNTRAILHSHS